MYWIFKEYNGVEEYSNLPRQTFPKAYQGNGHIDIVKKDTVLNGTTFGGIIYAKTCERVIDIDSLFDLKLARLEIKLGNQLLDYLKRKKMSKTFIIAEIGINHNGDMKLTKKLIAGAARAGCDAVKFQKRTLDTVYTKEDLDRPRDSPWGTTNRQQKRA